MENILRKIKKLIPEKVFLFFQPTYHYALSFFSALAYSFPSKQIKVIGVTGTKGKSSTVEIINAILEEAGYKTALSNTIRFKIGEESTDNLYKMSMPGRFFVQRFLRKAVEAKCDYVILEMTSQGSVQYRHKFIDLDTFVFTNLSPEHIESHGSYDNYVQAKVDMACARMIVVNADDPEAPRFLACEADKKVSYGIKDAGPFKILDEGIDFTFSGRAVHSPLSGLFNLYNLLAAMTCAKSLGVPDELIMSAVKKFGGIRGRVEKIEAGQDFTVIVDYAHTADSMEKLYQAFGTKRKICVFGATGGGRDIWKRSEMGRVADRYCDEIILTDDDSYDEDPEKIALAVAEGIKNKKPTIIIDRRLAIAEGLKKARTGDVVLITGKGTDPYLMGPNGTKIPWDDAEITRKELGKI